MLAYLKDQAAQGNQPDLVTMAGPQLSQTFITGLDWLGLPWLGVSGNRRVYTLNGRREKQKAKNTYGILERQLRIYFRKAERMPGLAGENLLRLLEMRLDNVVYRLGFADSLRQARQLVRHGHFTLNGRKTDIPSCLVKPGDVITWKENKVKLFPYQYAAQNIASKQIPGWLNVDTDTLTAKVLAQPTREDIGGTINERLIVEYYSK